MESLNLDLDKLRYLYETQDLTNKQILTFNDEEIPVEEETKELICIGSTNKGRINCNVETLYERYSLNVEINDLEKFYEGCLW